MLSASNTLVCINVGEMCFIPLNVHNELFNGACQFRWQHHSPVVSTFSTSIRLLIILIFHKAMHPPSPFSLFLYICLSFCSRPTPIPFS